MGITIHYKGKAKNAEAIDVLIKEFKRMAERFGWGCKIVDEGVKGELHPSWGYGFGYIPPKDQIEKDSIEFFPAMVSKTCNGYFKIWESKYADDIKNGLINGKMPKFLINTRKKGIALDLHPKCETLEFVFDANTLELANYERYEHSPNVVYGYNGFFCKTQYAGLETHILVCKIIKSAEKYVDFSNVHDEGDFYHTNNIETAKKAFGESAAMIESIRKVLKDMAPKLGLSVVTGDEM